MGSPKKGPKPPPPIAPPPVPSLDDARMKQMGNERRSKMRGRGASILTGDMGDLTAPPVTAKQLLGQ